MKIHDLKEWIDTGCEIEFTYNGKRYSITYGKKENGQEYISLCEFYKDDTEYDSLDDFIERADIEGELLSKIWEKVSDIDIF